MNRGMRRFLMMLGIFVFTCGLMTVSASAATKKLKNLDTSASYASVKKNATGVKSGTYTIKLGKKGSGYVRFKAPKTKTYTFTVSGLKTKAKYGYSSGYYQLRTVYTYKAIKKTILESKKVKTQGGTAYSLWVATKNGEYGSKNLRNLKSRYAKKKIKKGQTVYLYFYFYAGDTFKLSIK